MAAKKLAGKALTIDRTQGHGWLVLSQIEERAGNDGLVTLILRRGIECAPKDASLYRELGENLLRNGKVNDARQVLEEGLEVDPLCAPLYHSLAELEAKVFNLDGLAKLNKRAAAVFNTNALAARIPPQHLVKTSSDRNVDKSRDMEKRVAILADKVGYGLEIEIEEDIVSTTFDKMRRVEDEAVRALFGDDLVLDFNDDAPPSGTNEKPIEGEQINPDSNM